MEIASTIKRIAFLGDHLPRQCGIATFTSDICEAVAAQYPECQCLVGAVNDRLEGYDYPAQVRFEIDEKEVDSYRRAADYLNINDVEVVSVQHEFGIYGGPAGSHLLAFLRDVHMPVVTTLHTLLQDPSGDQRAVMKQLDTLSNRFIVMADRGKHFLETIYGIASEKIDVIPHGIPDIQFIDPNFNKDQFGVEGKTVLLTFGLLSPNKGIENVIEALPAILSQNPNVVYIILGATHPNLLAREGESYRIKLERLAEDRCVKRNVIFYNRFVTIEELKDFIGATDIYITPYLNESQITSGRLAPGRAPLLRLVSRSQRSRSATLRCEHGRLSGRVASGSRKPKSGRRIHPRVPFVARRNDASRSGTLRRKPKIECKTEYLPHSCFGAHLPFGKLNTLNLRPHQSNEKHPWLFPAEILEDRQNGCRYS
jgi:glycosyltransferase involved in cell wall biosynthesis